MTNNAKKFIHRVKINELLLILTQFEQGSGYGISVSKWII